MYRHNIAAANVAGGKLVPEADHLRHLPFGHAAPCASKRHRGPEYTRRLTSPQRVPPGPRILAPPLPFQIPDLRYVTGASSLL